jgi:hypothetical protein
VIAVLRGLVLGLVVLGYVAVKWLTGGDWRHGYRGPRRVTRPVRATAQSLAAVITGCVIWRPLATVATLAAAGVLLVVTALISRGRATSQDVLGSAAPYRTRAYVVRPRAKIAKHDVVANSDLGHVRQEVTR